MFPTMYEKNTLASSRISTSNMFYTNMKIKKKKKPPKRGAEKNAKNVFLYFTVDFRAFSPPRALV